MDLRRKNLRDPDETIGLELGGGSLVEVGDYTVGRVVQEPGWRWSTHMRPKVGGDWCQSRHIGVIISGRMGVELADGQSFVLEPDDVYDIPAGHDGYTIGDEPAVMIEWSGLRTFAAALGGPSTRSLVAILFTDLVGSTDIASALGDTAWRETLMTHYQAARAELERFRGREVKTTGDGILALFTAPGPAIQCASAIRTGARANGLDIRAGVHVGEVDVGPEDVHGIAVHEAARIMAAAGAGEIMASEIAHTLAAPAGFRFEDRGSHVLKGIDGERRLYALSDPS